MKYELCVTASAGPLSSNPEVILPIDIVNFFSLDPPPSSAFSLVSETSNESRHDPPVPRVGVQLDRPTASNIFVSDGTRGSDIPFDELPLESLAYDTTDSLEQRSLGNSDDNSSDDPEQTDEADGPELGNLALRDDCDDFVQHAINSAKIDSIYGENALRFSDLYVQDTQESSSALIEIKEGSRSERDGDQFEERVQALESPIDKSYDATRPSTPVREDHRSHDLPSHQVATGSLRYGPRPNGPSRPSFAVRVQEKMKAAGFNDQTHNFGSEAEQFDSEGAHEPDLDKIHSLAISDLNAEPPTDDHLISTTHTNSQVGAQSPSNGSRMLPQPPDSEGPIALSMMENDAPNASKTRSETPSSVRPPPPSEPLTDSACIDKQQPARPANSLGENESPVKKRIREMEERLRAQT